MSSAGTAGIPSHWSSALGGVGPQRGPLPWPEGQDRATTPGMPSSGSSGSIWTGMGQQ